MGVAFVIDQEQLLDGLMDFARTLTRGYDVAAVVHELTEHATRTLGVAGAGVSLYENGMLRFVSAGVEEIARVERVQELHQRGPCMQAIESGAPVLVGAFGWQDAQKWPDYVAAATDAGIGAVAAVPMRNGTKIGAVDLYRYSPHEWSDVEIKTAAVFCDIATAYVLNAAEIERHKRTSDQLQGALSSRVVIEQAKGIIACQRAITVDQAFVVLRKHARDHQTSLRAVATAVVQLGLRPDT